MTADGVYWGIFQSSDAFPWPPLTCRQLHGSYLDPCGAEEATEGQKGKKGGSPRGPGGATVGAGVCDAQASLGSLFLGMP